MKEKNHDDDIEINERQILAKQKLKIAFQRLLEKLEEQLNVFENTATVRYNKWQLENQEAIKAEDYAKIKPYKPDMYVEKMRMNLIMTIAEIQDAMAANEFQPTIME